MNFQTIRYQQHDRETLATNGWQVDWAGPPLVDLPVPRWYAARAPQGRDVPAGVVTLDDDVVETGLRPEAGTAITQLIGVATESWRAARSELSSSWPADAEVDQAAMRAAVDDWLGAPHYLAAFARWHLASAREAAAALAKHREPWDSRLTCVTVRAARDGGYEAWQGVGGYQQSIGIRPTVKAAVDAAVAQIASQRRELIAEALADFLPATPWVAGVGVTLGTALEGVPIYVRRGRVGGVSAASSWDLPIWQTIAAGGVEIVTPYSHDDEADRDRARATCRKAKALADAERREAVRRLVAGGVVRSTNGRTLERQAVAVGRHVWQIVGPVRMRSDGRVGLALVSDGRRQFWACLADARPAPPQGESAATG